MSNQRRREIVKRVREEGRQAAEVGRHRQTCPYGNDMNRYQWLGAYDAAQSEAFHRLLQSEGEAYEGPEDRSTATPDHA
jgi:ribosome modulation factor